MGEIQPPTARPFLTARWSNLALVTYDIDPSLLKNKTPPGCELDLRDGRAFVSLVAFDFLDTRVLGIGWPGYRNFPEINLRFYLRCNGQRGVSFIREYVPRRLVSSLARLFYNEPYRAARMSSQTREDDQSITLEHTLSVDGSQNAIRMSATKPPIRPDQSGIEHFFKEHEWGYGVSRQGKLLRYRVEHPTWDILPIQSYHLQWDWKKVYGPEWEFLKDQKPYSVIWACGSKVSVYPKSDEP